MTIREKELVESMKEYCQYSIPRRKNRKYNTSGTKNIFGDILNRLDYERKKIILELINRDEEAYWRANKNGIFVGIEGLCTKIRIKSCAMASKGRAFKIEELTDLEKIQARKIANSLVNEYVSNLKEKIMSY